MKVNNKYIRNSNYAISYVLKLNDFAYFVHVSFAAVINKHKSGGQIPSQQSSNFNNTNKRVDSIM